MKRFLGHSPWQAKSTSHSRQCRGNVSHLFRPNATCCSDDTSSTSGVSRMLPSRYFGSTKWSHEYRSPLRSNARLAPQVGEKTQTEGLPNQLAREKSKFNTKTSP